MPEKSSLNDSGTGGSPTPLDGPNAVAGYAQPVLTESPLATQLPKWDLRPPQTLLARRRQVRILPGI